MVYITSVKPLHLHAGLREGQINRSVMQHFSHPAAFIRAGASPDLFVIIAVSISGYIASPYLYPPTYSISSHLHLTK